jgi:hypothetical protein
MIMANSDTIYSTDRDTGRRADLIAADRVKGTEAYSTGGDQLGSIDSVLIEKVGGKVAYVVMSFGGFLGIGEKFHPLPWHMLTYDTGLSGYRVDLDRAALEGAPSYDRDHVDRFDANREGVDVDNYYRGRGGQRSPDYADSDDRRSAETRGFYSGEQQEERSRNVHVRGDRPAQHGDGGFYSPEQQMARNGGEDSDSAFRNPAEIEDRQTAGSVTTNSNWAGTTEKR